jgi:nucleoside-diphosphate-sugar epimerase
MEKALESKIPVVFISSQSAKVPASSIYATMKRTVEIIAKDIMHRGGDVKLLRLANVYGGFEYVKKKKTVIKQFLLKRAKGEIILIHGDGRQERDFIHVDDVCEFIWSALNYDGIIDHPVDIGTGIGTNMIDLARMCRHDSAFTDPRDAGSTSSIADVTEAKELFGYKAPNRIQSYLDTDPSLLS